MESVSENLHNLRKEYTRATLLENEVDRNPFVQFNDWFQSANQLEELEANAMVLATVSEGKPSTRIVLLKEFSENGLVFYTNYESRKGKELLKNPFASVLFFWPQFERQVRIEGEVKKVNAKQSDAYFKKRPRESQVSAIISPQSSRIERETLLVNLEKHAGEEALQRPDNWGGYIIKPNYFEFWQGGENRLHDRIIYSINKSKNWKIERLAP